VNDRIDPAANRIAEVVLEEKTVVRRNPDVQHELDVALFDLREGSYFRPQDIAGAAAGPFNLRLSIQENRLVMDIADGAATALDKVIITLGPFRRIIKDYFVVCESYFAAIKAASPSQIEAIDMGRRGLHNEGSELLQDRLDGKVEIDFDTARRLFTLICVLHIKG